MLINYMNARRDIVCNTIREKDIWDNCYETLKDILIENNYSISKYRGRKPYPKRKLEVETINDYIIIKKNCNIFNKDKQMIFINYKDILVNHATADQLYDYSKITRDLETNFPHTNDIIKKYPNDAYKNFDIIVGTYEGSTKFYYMILTKKSEDCQHILSVECNASTDDSSYINSTLKDYASVTDNLNSDTENNVTEIYRYLMKTYGHIKCMNFVNNAEMKFIAKE